MYLKSGVYVCIVDCVLHSRLIDDKGNCMVLESTCQLYKEFIIGFLAIFQHSISLSTRVHRLT